MNSAEITPEEIAQNHKLFEQRLAVYKKAGLDHIAARQNIIDLIETQPERTLEVGTGKGILTIFLSKISESVVSVDTDAQEQRTALLNALYHGTAGNVTFVCKDASSLDYPDNHFDLVVSAISFHHFEDPEPVIAEMVRLAKQTLIITDFNDHGFSVIESAHRTENRTHYKTPHDFTEVGTWLKRYGLSVIRADDLWQTIFVATKSDSLKRVL